MSNLRRNGVVRPHAGQEAVMFSQPPPPKQPWQGAERFVREEFANLDRDAARRAQLGIQNPKWRESIRHWYRWLTRRKAPER